MTHNKRIEEIRSKLPKIETRFTPVSPRASKVHVPSGGGVIRGYGAVFGQWSEDLGGFRERIAPGAFARSLKERPDILGLLNHDPSLIVGRTSAGTMRVVEDSVGLLCEYTPPDTNVAADVVELVRTGHIDGMSFSFLTIDDYWWPDEKTGEACRELRDVDLREVGPVTFPAYPGTTIGPGSGGRGAEPPAVERPSRPTPTPNLDALRRTIARLRRIELDDSRIVPGSPQDLQLEKDCVEDMLIEAHDAGNEDRVAELLRLRGEIETRIINEQSKGTRYVHGRYPI